MGEKLEQISYIYVKWVVDLLRLMWPYQWPIIIEEAMMMTRYDTRTARTRNGMAEARL